MSGRTEAKEKQRHSKDCVTALAVVKSMGGPTPLRWTCRHRVDGSEILAYVMAQDGLAAIAETKAFVGVNARANAELIVRSVNGFEQCRPLLAELSSTLELCLESGSLNWEAEQEAEIVLAKAKRILAPS